MHARTGGWSRVQPIASATQALAVLACHMRGWFAVSQLPYANACHMRGWSRANHGFCSTGELRLTESCCFELSQRGSKGRLVGERAVAAQKQLLVPGPRGGNDGCAKDEAEPGMERWSYVDPWRKEAKRPRGWWEHVGGVNILVDPAMKSYIHAYTHTYIHIYIHTLFTFTFSYMASVHTAAYQGGQAHSSLIQGSDTHPCSAMW